MTLPSLLTPLNHLGSDATCTVKNQLNEWFKLVDLGEISWLLDISVTWDLNACMISLGQQAYMDHILAWMKLTDMKPVAMPLEPGIDLSCDSPAMSVQPLFAAEKSEYGEGIGSLMYVCLRSHPDIFYVIATLSCFVELP